MTASCLIVFCYRANYVFRVLFDKELKKEEKKKKEREKKEKCFT